MNKEKHYYVIKDEAYGDEQLLVKLTQEEYNAIKFLIEWLNQDLYIYNAKDIAKEVPND